MKPSAQLDEKTAFIGEVQKAIEALQSSDEVALKKTCFALSTKLKVCMHFAIFNLLLVLRLQEEKYAKEFKAQNGLAALKKQILASTRNILSYSLQALEAYLSASADYNFLNQVPVSLLSIFPSFSFPSFLSLSLPSFLFPFLSFSLLLCSQIPVW